MTIKYDIEINEKSIVNKLHKIINQIYKLLPEREEGADWEKPLKNIILDLAGMKSLISKYNEPLFSILCKLEGLLTLTKQEDFQLYRSTIFSCLGELGALSKNVGIK